MSDDAPKKRRVNVPGKDLTDATSVPNVGTGTPGGSGDCRPNVIVEVVGGPTTSDQRRQNVIAVEWWRGPMTHQRKGGSTFQEILAIAV